jgi:hypothetical protein
VPIEHDSFPNIALIQRGFIGTTPWSPQFAISLRTLDSFYRIQMQHPSLGIRPYVRALCDINSVSYRSHYGRAFTSAYDIYLLLHREIDKLVATATRRTATDYLKSICPCCQHTTTDDEPLDYEICLALDGNSSLKRFGDATKTSPQNFPSRFILPRDYVDSFAEEVRHRKSAPKKGKKKGPEPAAAGGRDIEAVGEGVEAGFESDDDPQQAEYEYDMAVTHHGPQLQADREDAEEGRWIFKEVDPTGTEVVISECVDRWKANADDSKKGNMLVFIQAFLTQRIRHV